jgi:hypothetical protein
MLSHANLLMRWGDFAGEAIISLAKRDISLRNDFVSPSASQAIEIVGVRNVKFRGFVRFQGFATHIISRLFRRPFSNTPVGSSHNLVSQNKIIARVRFQAKSKGATVKRRDGQKARP